MNTVAIEKKTTKIHPHKFTLWVGIGSILMMFAGLTSAYIVKRNQANWQTFDLPAAFWYSTAVIILSSFTLMMAVSSFKKRMMSKYRLLMGATLLLGSVFIILQVVGFQQLWKLGITLQGNVSFRNRCSIKFYSRIEVIHNATANLRLGIFQHRVAINHVTD